MTNHSKVGCIAPRTQECKQNALNVNTHDCLLLITMQITVRKKSQRPVPALAAAASVWQYAACHLPACQATAQETCKTALHSATQHQNRPMQQVIAQCVVRECVMLCLCRHYSLHSSSLMQAQDTDRMQSMHDYRVLGLRVYITMIIIVIIIVMIIILIILIITLSSSG